MRRPFLNRNSHRKVTAKKGMKSYYANLQLPSKYTKTLDGQYYFLFL